MNQTNSRPLTLSQKATRLLAGFVIAVAVAAAVAVWWWRDATPRVTPEILNAAIERWNAAEIASYDVTIQKTGVHDDVIQVKVRDGVPTFMSSDDREITDPRLRETWTVDAQFSYIEIDLEELSRAANPGQIWLRAEFDPETGVPLRYERTELGQPKTGWKLIELRPTVANP